MAWGRRSRLPRRVRGGRRRGRRRGPTGRAQSCATGRPGWGRGREGAAGGPFEQQVGPSPRGGVWQGRRASTPLPLTSARALLRVRGRGAGRGPLGAGVLEVRMGGVARNTARRESEFFVVVWAASPTIRPPRFLALAALGGGWPAGGARARVCVIKNTAPCAPPDAKKKPPPPPQNTPSLPGAPTPTLPTQPFHSPHPWTPWTASWTPTTPC